MGRAHRPLSNRMMFAFGARRSGTYWLQHVLAAHPDVAEIPAETHLFSHGITPLLERFHHGARASPRVGAVYVDREVLLDATRDFCDRVLGDFRKPDAPFLLERTPVHVHCAELIGEIYPDAHLVHIIRDGRDVVRSLLARPWGPSEVEEAAGEWQSSITNGRAARSHPGYVEIRYEELLADPGATIEDLYARLGLRLTPAIMGTASNRAAIRVNSGGMAPTAATDGPKRVLSSREVQAFERIAGGLLEELGYERSMPGRSSREPGDPQARTPGLGRLARRAWPRRRSAPSTGAGHARVSMNLLDSLLTLVRQKRPEGVGELLAPDATVTIGDGDSSVELRGPDGAKCLIEALGEDPALGCPQIGGEVVTLGSGVAGILTYQLEDGSHAQRLLLVAAAAGGRLAQIALFRFPATRPSSVGSIRVAP